ncbi:MAG TPA: tetratricopeptide repeat protein [bacterium]|nr:tetratricopeptide repeat protein [bacterium]
MKKTKPLSGRLAACAVVWAAVICSGPAGAAPAGDVVQAKGLIEAGRGEEAINILTAACYARADELAPHFYLAYCYGVAGNLEEARAEYEICARCDPDRPEIHYNLGVILNKMGLYQAAAEAFEEALLLDPGLVAANFNCGLSHYYAHEPVPAIKFYREARALAPEDISILYWLALAYEEIDQRVALSIWEDYVRQTVNVAAETPNLKSARNHISALRAGKKP